MRGIPNPAFQFFPMDRGNIVALGPVALGAARLPTDSIGNLTLTLTNVVVGSAVQVESQSGGTVIYNGTAATTSPVLTIPVYSSGNPLNDLRIKVRKGSASPFYRPYETLATAFVGSSSIYVSQILDE